MTKERMLLGETARRVRTIAQPVAQQRVFEMPYVRPVFILAIADLHHLRCVLLDTVRLDGLPKQIHYDLHCWFLLACGDSRAFGYVSSDESPKSLVENTSSDWHLFSYAYSNISQLRTRTCGRVEHKWLNQDPLGEMFDPNLYRFNYNSPVDHVDQDGLTGWAMNNPTRWWNPNAPDFYPTYPGTVDDPMFHFDEDQFLEDFGEGAAAVLDGLIPLVDPFGDDYYDPCDPWSKWSQGVGAASREAAFTGIGGAVIKSAAALNPASAAAYAELNILEKAVLNRNWLPHLMNGSVSPATGMVLGVASAGANAVGLYDAYTHFGPALGY